PEFLRAMLAHLRTLDVDIVSMDEVHQRLSQRNFARRFACFTLDDGYRDNRDFALPVMREFDAPLTVYVASDFAEGTGRLWWVALERVIAKASAIEAPIGGVVTSFDTSTPAAKQAAFDRLHDWLRARPGEHDQQREISALQRVSLNGNYQDERIIPVLTSGAATAMWNGFRRIDAA